MWTGLLGLSVVAITAAQTCDFCRMEYGNDVRHVCQYDGAQTEDVHNRNRYFWNVSNRRDFGEFLDSEEAIRNLIDERCIDYSTVLAIQDALIGNGRRYGLGGDRLNVPTGEMEFLGIDVPGSFEGNIAKRVAKSIAEHVRTPQQALAITKAFNATFSPNSVVDCSNWHQQSPFRVYSLFEPVDCLSLAWDFSQKEPKLRPVPIDNRGFYLTSQKKYVILQKNGMIVIEQNRDCTMDWTIL